MQKVTIAVFGEKDAELIKRYLPESPCESCSAGAGCVGCPAHRQWQKDYEAPLKSANVLEYAVRYNHYASSFRECLHKLNSGFKNLLGLGDELGEIAPQVLQGLVDESIPLIADLLNKYLQLKKELQESAESSKNGNETTAKEIENINLFS